MPGDPYDELPEWLKRPAAAPPAHEPQPELPPEPSPETLPDWLATPAEPPVEEEVQPVSLEELRDEATAAVQPAPEPEKKAPRRRGVGGLLTGLMPQQRLVLSILLLMDVLLLGCMCLVMSGRIALPVP